MFAIPALLHLRHDYDAHKCMHIYDLFTNTLFVAQVKALAHHRESELNYLTNELESLQYAFEASGTHSVRHASKPLTLC
jgi:hypothetical protein